MNTYLLRVRGFFVFLKLNISIFLRKLNIGYHAICGNDTINCELLHSFNCK